MSFTKLTVRPKAPVSVPVATHNASGSMSGIDEELQRLSDKIELNCEAVERQRFQLSTFTESTGKQVYALNRVIMERDEKLKAEFKEVWKIFWVVTAISWVAMGGVVWMLLSQSL